MAGADRPWRLQHVPRHQQPAASALAGALPGSQQGSNVPRPRLAQGPKHSRAVDAAFSLR